MDIERAKILRGQDFKKAATGILSVVQGRTELRPYTVHAAAYALLRAGEFNNPFFENLDNLLDVMGEKESERGLFLKEELHDIWPDLYRKVTDYSREELEATILFYEPDYMGKSVEITPPGVSALARELLNIRDCDSIADFGTGFGGFLRDCCLEYPDVSYYGLDIDPRAKEIAEMRAEILGQNITLEQGDILDMKQNDHRFDAAFANYPLGMRMRSHAGKMSDDGHAAWNRPEFLKASSMDWAFSAAVYGTIRGPKRAICIVTNGSTWNGLDKPARRGFLERGSVEAVIALPERLFESTLVATTMIVFSHGHSSVRMIDARNMCEKGRWGNTITEENVRQILRCMGEDTEFSTMVSYEELRANDFILYPVRYLAVQTDIPNGTPFGDVIRNVTRGIQIRAEELHAMASDKPTEPVYVSLSNIHDGIMDDDLPHISADGKRYDKYSLTPNALVLSKTGAPFKLAVAEVSDNRKTIVTGNLYIIEIDEEKADPYYIKAFFESDAGMAALSNAAAGAVIPTISLEQLKKIIVPCPPLEEQKRVAEQYRAAEDNVKILRRRLEKALSKMKHLLDEEGR